MRTRQRRSLEDAQLLMTPMIDVVFLLLIFFIAVTSESIPLSILDASRGNAQPGNDTIDVRIGVLPSGFTIDGITVDSGRLDGALSSIIARSKRQRVVVVCSEQSRHEKLVEALDLCEKNGIEQVAIMSRTGP